MASRRMSAAWQLIQEEVDDDLPEDDGDERRIEAIYGVRGQTTSCCGACGTSRGASRPM